MKKRLITLTAVAALGAASLGAYHSSLAASGMANPPAPQTAVHKKPCKKPPQGMRQAAASPWHLGLRFDKQLTQSDAKTLVSAALLMQGRHDLVVGKVETKSNQSKQPIYLVSINDAKGTTVTTVVVDSQSGHIHPLGLKGKPGKPGPRH